MGKLRPFVRKDSYMPNKKWIPFVIGNGYTTTDGASGPAPEWETVTGNPVSFNALTPFPLRQLSVAFSPVQDLNGYDSPWPEGGGKNKFGLTATDFENGTVLGSGKQVYLTLKPNTEYTLSSNDDTGSASQTNIWFNGGSSSTNGVFKDRPRTTTTDENGQLYISIRTTEISRIFANFWIQLEEGSSATSYAPYSNECPISGWDSLTVEQRGKNLLNLAGWLDSLGIPYTIDNDGWFLVSGTSGSGGNVYANVYTLPLIHGSAFMEFDQSRSTITNFRMTLLRDGTAIAESATGNPSEAKIENRRFNQFRFNFASGGTFCIKVSVVNDTTISDYTPYNPSSRSISIQLGDTYYGAQLDVLSGLLRVTHIKKAITHVTPWGATTKGYAVYVVVNEATHVVTAGQKPSLISNIFTWDSTNGYAKMEVFTYGGTSGAPQTMSFILPSTITSQAEANAWFAANPTECMFALSTPIPIQLTPQEVQSLAGDNTMWSDANGDLTVTYRSN